MEQTASSSAPARTEEETEEMLDRMLTRLALCDDSKLQPLLARLLPLAISSLSSQSTAVRNKVVEILSHVNKRVKHQTEIGLPLLELWELYRGESAVPMVRNFCIVYIEMAFERVDVKVKESMAPLLVANVSNLPPQHQEIILRIVSKVIGECHSKQIDEEIAAKYRSTNGAKDRELFLEFCLHLMLYQQPPQGGGCPPGLSISQSNRITGKTVLKTDVLLIRKLGILNVVDAMELSPELVYPLYLAASADSQEPVVKRGEELLKKKASSANLDDPNLMSRLFSLFNGTTADNVVPELRVVPGGPGLKTKLMSTFCKSITAANSFPATLQCIFGCIYGSGTTSRLKQFGMEFTVWVFKHLQVSLDGTGRKLYLDQRNITLFVIPLSQARVNQLQLMGPIILTGIVKLLDSYSVSGTDTSSREIKTFSFQAIGLLAQRLPHLFRDKIEMAVRLFDALQVELQSLRLVIQETASALATAYKGAPVAVLMELERLLLKNCHAEQNEVRFCAVRWATTLFDLQHCPSRFICMLGSADSRLDIREMALEGLFPLKDEGHKTSQSLDIKYPKLAEMLGYILQQYPALLNSSDTREQKLLFPSQLYVVMIRFLVKCFESELEHNSSIGRSSDFLSSAQKMCSLIQHAMAYEAPLELHAIASKTLITIGTYLPEMVATHYASRISWLKQLLSHVDVDTRESAARLLGIACSAIPVTASADIINELLAWISKRNTLRYEATHGALCALGYVTADYVSRTSAIPDTLFQNVLKCLTDVANSETAVLASVAMQALGHIGLRTPLPLQEGSVTGHVLIVLREKLTKLLGGDDVKSIQKIVISLGHICVKEASSSCLDTALDLILSLSRSKAEDVLFAAGEALSFLWGGVPVTADMILKTNYSSLSTTSNFLMGDINSSLSKFCTTGKDESVDDYHITVRTAVTSKLFDSLLYSSRKEERCAGAVWLVSLTMYCGRHPSIQKMLPEIQEAFSHLLGDQNELTQELASQGMSIVYELGDSSMQKNLVDALVTTLTGTGKRKRAIKLVEESEVFQDGAIGESPTGGKLTTYKELCSLANEMGQPDLIYKFMDLANHQTALNSKRGAAFGFSKIAKQAGDALQPHLRLLIPRLVRYQYDPDKNVQDAMAHIWKSLVAEPKKTIDEHLDLIIDDLVSQSGSRLWRSREASCLALSDIIQGRRFDEIGNHLNKLWTTAFRAMDDIKETVRNAGDRLCRSVTTLTLRLCDISLTEVSDAGKAVEIVLPLLLAEGILSKVDSVRKASIGVVMKLAKGAGTALRPHLPNLVCCMLESLSSLEDQRLNYVELHAANAGIQAEKLENLRISISKGSPMWETLDLCINVIDAESLNLLVPRLGQLVRSGVGLNTRVGVSNFITLLVQKVGSDIKPFTNVLLRLLFPVVKEEKSYSAKRAFASACAIVLKHANPSQAEKLIEDTTALHAGDVNEQITCSVLLKSYTSMASDLVSAYQAAITPVIFISRFEDDKNVSALYEELWEDNASGERITVQLYLVEIVSLICGGLSSSSWGSKRKSAQAISRLAEVLGESLSPYHQVLLESLMKELPGRLWEGKDALLHAVGALSSACHKAISLENPDLPNTILGVVSSACTKKVKKYREAAFLALNQVIKAFDNPEFFGIVFPLLYGMSSSATPDKSGSDVAGDTSKSESDVGSMPHEKLLTCATSCIHVAHPKDIVEQQNNLIQMVSTFLSPGFQWTVKMSAFSVIVELCNKIRSILDDPEEISLHSSAASLFDELFHSSSPKIVDCLSTVKIAQVHIAASDCLLETIKLHKKVEMVHKEDTVLKRELLHHYEIEKSEEAKSNLKQCIDILEDLDRTDAPAT